MEQRSLAGYRDDGRRSSGNYDQALQHLHDQLSPTSVSVTTSEPIEQTCQKISDVLGQVGHNSTGNTSFGGVAYELPVLPGLTVEGFGSISLPLHKDQVDVLSTQCSAKGDNVWEVTPGQIRTVNLEWEQGLKVLCGVCADALGLSSVILKSELSKMLIFGPGSYSEQVRDWSDDDQVVARLVVQLPSEYMGGGLSVLDGQTKQQFCYNLGKTDGAAAFKPHYTVIVRNASYTMNEVTSGYCLAMVYSLCLPPGMSTKTSNKSLRVQLADAITELKHRDAVGEVRPPMPRSSDKSRFALMLSKSCTREDIERKGFEALVGLDRDRYQLLCRANSLQSAGKRLKFYLACLQQCGKQSGATWFTATGEKLGNGTFVDWTRNLNVLNPDRQPLNELWRSNSLSEHEQCAIVGWPDSDDTTNTYELMGDYGATAAVLAGNRIDHGKLRKILTAAISQDNSPVSLEFCQKLCETIVELDDFSLAAAFFRKFFPRLSRKDMLVPALALTVRKFGWDLVGASVLSSLDGMGLALKLASALEGIPHAQYDLTVLAVEKARELVVSNPIYFTSSPDLGLLWQLAVASMNLQLFQQVVHLLESLDGKLLGSVMEMLINSADISKHPKHWSGLTSIATRRRQWLMNEMEEIKKPFTWEVPVADFPDADMILAFLEGPEEYLQLQGFASLVAARSRAQLLRQHIKAPITVTADGRGQEACVKILKTGGIFGLNTKKMAEYSDEVTRLDQLLHPEQESNDGITGKKHPREEEVGSVGSA